MSGQGKAHLRLPPIKQELLFCEPPNRSFIRYETHRRMHYLDLPPPFLTFVPPFALRASLFSAKSQRFFYPHLKVKVANRGGTLGAIATRADAKQGFPPFTAKFDQFVKFASIRCGETRSREQLARLMTRIVDPSLSSGAAAAREWRRLAKTFGLWEVS